MKKPDKKQSSIAEHFPLNMRNASSVSSRPLFKKDDGSRPTGEVVMPGITPREERISVNQGLSNVIRPK